MIFWVQITLAFLAGILWNKFWTGFVNAGYSIIMFKKTQNACLEMMQQASDSVQIAMDMKYNFLEDSERNPKNIEFEKRFDEKMFSGLRNSMVRGLRDAIPKNYNTIATYSTWEEAIKLLEDPK